MDTRDLLTAPPAPDRTWATLQRVGALLGLTRCWYWNRAYHFPVGDEGWTIAVRPESAGRFRVDGCQWSVPRVTLWALASDEDRLAGAVLDLREQIEGVQSGV
jgi:hypothetical protein